MAEPQRLIWVIDTSSICQIRRSIQNSEKPNVFSQLTARVERGAVVFVKQVVDELERAAEGKDVDDQLAWAQRNRGLATRIAPSLDEVKEVLAKVPTVIDAEKDSGAEEADPYLLALAMKLRGEEKDARIITEENRDYPSKMSLSTAAGLLGVPSVPLKAFLQFERILEK
jgi:hypothetical protein